MVDVLIVVMFPGCPEGFNLIHRNGTPARLAQSPSCVSLSPIITAVLTPIYSIVFSTIFGSGLRNPTDPDTITASKRSNSPSFFKIIL